MTSPKAFKGPLYSVIVDGNKVAQFNALQRYTSGQTRNVQKIYAERLGVHVGQVTVRYVGVGR